MPMEPSDNVIPGDSAPSEPVTPEASPVDPPDFGVPLPPPEAFGPPPERPAPWEPNWPGILGVILPCLFPLGAVGLLNFTLWAFPALGERVLGTAVRLNFAFPPLSGFQTVCVFVLWVVVLAARFWWQVTLAVWDGCREIAFWSRFLMGWLLASLLATGLLSQFNSPENIAFGVIFTFEHLRLWIYAPLLLFGLFLVPWEGFFTQQERGS